MTTGFLITCFFFGLCYVAGVSGQRNDYQDFQNIKTYQSHAVLTIQPLSEKGHPQVLFVEEYHDRNQKAGRLDISSKRVTKNHFYFLNEDKAVSITSIDHNCAVNDIKSFIAKEGLDVFSSRADDIIGPSAWFLPDSKQAVTNKGTANIRGISCSKWSYQIAKNKLVQNVDLYLSDKDWNSTGLAAPFAEPVRANLTLAMENGTLVTSATIDFTFFIVKQTFENEETFLIPPGLGCKSLNIKSQNLKDNLTSDIMSFYHDETLIADDPKEQYSYINVYQMVVDDKNNIQQVEGAMYSTNYIYLTQVYEFKNGVKYVLKKDKTCRILPISENYVGMFLPFNTNTKKMNFIAEQFYLTSNYSYLGRKYHRSILCDIYEMMEETERGRMVTTYYLATSDYLSDIDRDANKRIIVQITRRDYYTNLLPRTRPIAELETDFFKVKHLESDDALANIETCFLEESQKSFFAIHLPFDKPETMNVITSNQKEFVKKGRDQIYNAAKISRLRLPYLQVFVDSKSATLLGRMLNRPPVLSGFLENPPTITDQTFTNTQSPEECAVQCLSAPYETCGNFDYCPERCYNNPFVGESHTPFPEKCTHFERAVLDSTLEEKPLNEALKILNEAVSKNQISITIKDDKGKDYNLLAKSMDKDVNPFPDNNKVKTKKYESIFLGHELYLNHHSVYEVDQPVLSVEECYSKCQSIYYMYCAGFSYCSFTSKCRFTSSYLKIGDKKERDEISIATGCEVFRIKALEFFKEYPGKVPISRGQAMQYYVGSPDECALNCREYSDFPCKGFEFCDKEDTKICIMHKRHILDESLPSDDVTQLCSFYFLDYGANFADAGSVVIMDPLGVKLQSMSFDDCAKLCFTQPELQCRSINYCPQIDLINKPSECQINTKTLSDHGVDTDISELCQHYKLLEETSITSLPTLPTRPTKEIGSKTTPSATKPSASSSGTTSATDGTDATREDVRPTIKSVVRQGVEQGAFTGAIIGMLIFGIMVGALGFLVYSYYRSRKDDSGITVRFTRENI